MSDRKYIPAQGFPLDGASFTQHRQNCSQCGAFDPEKPATLALLCLDGSVLWKRDNVQPRQREPEPHNPNHASAAEIRKLMRYK